MNTAAAHLAGHKYQALDSLRGVCAILVVLFHMKSFGFINQMEVVKQGWIFVDFFFVLSGFVIASAYSTRFQQGYSLMKFMALRFGRIYPLHLFILLLFLGWECLKLATGRADAFQSPLNMAQFAENLALLQAFGLSNQPTWNVPSWSISAEMWTYLVFGVLMLTARRWSVLAALVIALACALILTQLGDPWLERTTTWALLRSVYGFGLGVVGFWIFQKLDLSIPRLAGSFLEIAMVALVVLFVSGVGNGAWTLLAPPVFLVAVLLFAFESGVLSVVLKRPFGLMLGLLSYSIYMVHWFILIRMAFVAELVSRKLGIPLASNVNDQAVATGAQKFFGSADQPWIGDVMAIVTIGVTIAVSWLTFKFVEMPCRDYVRQRIARNSANPGPNHVRAS